MFRAVNEYLGNTVVFEPKGYYERFDDDGNPEFHSGDVFARSDTPELAASKIVGGAILGLWSMFNNNGLIKDNAKIFIYEIKEKPQKDLSRVRIDDFEYLKEVRYNKPVIGHYVGYFVFDKKFNEAAEIFYRRFDLDPWEEFSDEESEIWDYFVNFIKTVKKNNLKKD